MKVVCYFDGKLKISPFMKFLSKYDIKPSDSQKQKNHKDNMLVLIDCVICTAAENNGVVGGHFSKPLRGLPFQELRVKDGKTLNRIFYCCYHRDMLVLFNGFDKPDLKGEVKKKKKVNKKEQEAIKLALEYYNDFHNNPDHYEPYE